MFTIGYEYFCNVVGKAVALMPGGKTPQSFSVDCRDPKLGYVPGNIQPMAFGRNAAIQARAKCKACIWGITAEWKVYTLTLAEEVPF
jgi:hypothetical protein